MVYNFLKISMAINPKRGDIWIVDLNPIIGCEIAKKRPCLVLSEDRSNKIMQTITILPISTGQTSYYILHIDLSEEKDLKKNSHLVLQHIRSVSKLRLSKKIGEIKNNKIFDEIKWRLDKYLGFDN